ncbi:hypothetical protein GF339_19230 [candidate division KSB3 bacterium]|uniref:Uncharacterized protein n=1 Tax=candidate division KSB3 bacterium TaxID=2044937 RepID=A0A9D5JYX4_9BACT|nr:hypothetical protein [candidate division KSB3 bacterium]MBD3326725.1 hypothetical protein [candidate division KSB3 bacterium]
MTPPEPSQPSITQATVKLHRSTHHPGKVEVTLTLTITDKQTIHETLEETEVNPFLARYGLSPITLTTLGEKTNRQITEIVEVEQETQSEALDQTDR